MKFIRAAMELLLHLFGFAAMMFIACVLLSLLSLI
jgi:hypothetical protein